MKTMIRLCFLLLIIMSTEILANDRALVCGVDGLMHGDTFTLTSDNKLIVSTGGGWEGSKKTQTEAIVKKGTITTKKTLILEGEDPQVVQEVSEVIRISDVSNIYVLQVELTGRGDTFTGKILKGAMSFDDGGESIVLDSLICGWQD